MDRTFVGSMITDTVYDLLPSPDIELTPCIEDAIANLVDEIEAMMDSYAPVKFSDVEEVCNVYARELEL